MNNQTMLLLGMVKMKHPSADHYEMVEVKGFDVVGFFFPFVRSIFGSTGARVKILYAFTFWAYPIWCWYIGFNYKKMAFETKLKNGWVISSEDKNQAA
jgi:hypothetical protein